MTNLDWMHDIILEALGVSLEEPRVAEILYNLPGRLQRHIEDYGLSDTEVRGNVYEYLTELTRKDWIKN